MLVTRHCMLRRKLYFIDERLHKKKRIYNCHIHGSCQSTSQWKCLSIFWHEVCKQFTVHSMNGFVCIEDKWWCVGFHLAARRLEKNNSFFLDSGIVVRYDKIHIVVMFFLAHPPIKKGVTTKTSSSIYIYICTSKRQHLPHQNYYLRS